MKTPDRTQAQREMELFPGAIEGGKTADMEEVEEGDCTDCAEWGVNCSPYSEMAGRTDCTAFRKRERGV